MDNPDIHNMATNSHRPSAVRLIAGVLIVFWAMSWAPALHAQLSTNDHLADAGFWPTQNGESRKDYVGAAVCATCHASITAAQQLTPMAHAAMLADSATILHAHQDLSFTAGAYEYTIKTTPKQSVYSVTDGTHTLNDMLVWAFGTGRVGQSYLFKRDDGNFYEARVTYFKSLQNLNFTPARALTSPRDLEEAMGRKVEPSEVGRCFACHTTASTIGDTFDEKNLIPGVSCEACHGPGAAHVAEMKALMDGKSASAATAATHATGVHNAVFNPASLGPSDSVDFCGACHSTWWDVKLAGTRGPSTARSPPYRLETSKCWRNGDARLTCIACHDPHVQLHTNPASYDNKCLSCHVNAAGMKPTALVPGAACPVSTKNCVSCHMPKVYVPEMHDTFTDHRIRIVRAGAPYPE